MHEVLSQELFTQAKEIKPGDHLVALYSVEREIADYVSAYIQSALAQEARCIYIAGDLDTSEVPRPFNTSVKNGDLVVLGHAEIYSKEGRLSPDKLIETIIDLAKTALRDGYT